MLSSGPASERRRSSIRVGSSARTGSESLCLRTCSADWPEPYTADLPGCWHHHLWSEGADLTTRRPFFLHNEVIECKLHLSHPLCLFLCLPFCFSCWKICFERTGKLLPDPQYQSHHRRMMRSRRRPVPCYHTGHRRGAEAKLEKHPHPPRSWLEAGSTTRLDGKESMKERSKRQIMLSVLIGNVYFFCNILHELTVILHAKLLPVDGPLCSNFSACFQMLHLQREKHYSI